MAKNGVDQSWEEFLTPEILRNKLISASLYLAAFEMLKDSVVGRRGADERNGYREDCPDRKRRTDCRAANAIVGHAIVGTSGRTVAFRPLRQRPVSAARDLRARCSECSRPRRRRLQSKRRGRRGLARPGADRRLLCAEGAASTGSEPVRPDGHL